MPLDLLVVERFVAFEHVGAVELVAGHSAGHSGADVAVAGVAELQLVAVSVAVAVAVAADEHELVLVLVLVLVPVPVPVPALVVLEPNGPVVGPVVVPVIVHSDEFAAGLVVGGRVD